MQYLSETELSQFISRNLNYPALIFTEKRENPVGREDNIPLEWLEQEKCLDHPSFFGISQPGEFYVFQLAIFAISQSLKNPRIIFQDLMNSNENNLIPGSASRAISLSGIGPDNQMFTKNITINPHHLQIIWIGIDIPQNIQGNFCGEWQISFENSPSQNVTVNLKVEGDILTDYGEKDAWRLARLRWLDSNLGLNSQNVVAPYIPLKRFQNTIKILGKDLILDSNGLPCQIQSYFNPSNTRIESTLQKKLLSNGFQFKLISKSENYFNISPKLDFLQELPTKISWEAKAENENVIQQVKGNVEYDGFGSISIIIKSKIELDLDDCVLEIPFNNSNIKNMVGLNYRDGTRPSNHIWKWDQSHHQDAVWLGDVNAGIQLRFKDLNYRRPLVNIYYKYSPLNLPESWYNEGKGGIIMGSQDSSVYSLKIYSGPRKLSPNKPLTFIFDFYLTPFRPIDTNSQWKTRYLHEPPGPKVEFTDNPLKVIKAGANVVNWHHNSLYNPYINYPYNDDSFSIIRDTIRQFHNEKLQVKLYYTTREITNNMPELIPFFSMNGEIIFPGPGNRIKSVVNPRGPHPWLQENLRKNYIPAWTEVVKYNYNKPDLAVITTPDTRWNNFFIEGLRYLIQHADIDGIYIDDTQLDRLCMQRIRYLLDQKNPKGLIDFHSWNHFCDKAGFGDNINIYLELLPYIDRNWWGEGFDYDASPAFWLLEYSGIPFGLMGEMLQGGGNPWRGMLYGMTNRLKWQGDPRPLWQFFDAYGIQGSRYYGYWDPECPIQTNRTDILASAYAKTDQVIIVIASWAVLTQKIDLKIDFQKLGLNPDQCKLFSPKISKFQKKKVWKLYEKISIPRKKGCLIVISNKNSK